MFVEDSCISYVHFFLLHLIFNEFTLFYFIKVLVCNGWGVVAAWIPAPLPQIVEEPVTQLAIADLGFDLGVWLRNLCLSSGWKNGCCPSSHPMCIPRRKEGRQRAKGTCQLIHMLPWGLAVMPAHRLCSWYLLRITKMLAPSLHADLH